MVCFCPWWKKLLWGTQGADIKIYSASYENISAPPNIGSFPDEKKSSTHLCFFLSIFYSCLTYIQFTFLSLLRGQTCILFTGLIKSDFSLYSFLTYIFKKVIDPLINVQLFEWFNKAESKKGYFSSNKFLLYASRKKMH